MAFALGVVGIAALVFLAGMAIGSLIGEPPPSLRPADLQQDYRADIQNKVNQWNRIKRYISKYKRDQHENRHHYNPIISWNRRTFYAVLVYTGLTFMLLVVGFCSLQSSDVSSEAENRAWVGPIQGGIDGALNIGQPINVIVRYSNTGKQPASGFWASIFVFTEMKSSLDRNVGSPAVSKLADECMGGAGLEEGFGGVIYPSSQSYMKYRSVGFSQIPAAEQDQSFVATKAMVEGREAIIAVGCFVYRSINRIRHSSFCYYYLSGVTDPNEIAVCAVGNKAD